jgi:hypothetical protein
LSSGRARRPASGGATEGHFTLRDVKVQANTLLNEDIKELKSAFQQVWDFVRSRFPNNARAIEGGLDACAAYTFAAVSQTQLPYSARNKTLTHPSAFVVANKRRLGQSFRNLNTDVVAALAGERAHRRSLPRNHGASSADAPSKHGWLSKARVLQGHFKVGGDNPDAAPYLPVHDPLLLDIVRLVGGIFSSLREADEQRSTPLPSSPEFRNQLKRWFRAIRSAAKHLKYAFARKGMLGANAASDIAAMHCDDREHWGASKALAGAAQAAAGAASATPSAFWHFLQTAILEAARLGPGALWRACMASVDCAQHAHCHHPVSASRVLQAHHQQRASFGGKPVAKV